MSGHDKLHLALGTAFAGVAVLGAPSTIPAAAALVALNLAAGGWWKT